MYRYSMEVAEQQNIRKEVDEHPGTTTKFIVLAPWYQVLLSGNTPGTGIVLGAAWKSK